MAQTENVTTKFKVDISDLKKNITEANKQIKLANAEFKNATAGMDKWSESADGLTAKIAQQNKIVDAEKSKLDALKAQLDRLNKSQENGEKIIKDLTAKYETAAKEFGETSDEAKKYAKQLKEAQEAQERNTKAADNLTIQIINQDTAVKKAESQIDKYTKQLDDMQREMSENEKTAEDTSNALEDTGKSAQDAGDEAEKAGNGGFTVFKQVLGNLTTQVINKAVDVMKDLAKQMVEVVTATAEAGDEIDKMSQKIGISAESYQEWQYVFERSGASIDGLQSGMKKLSTVITDAANGSESAAAKLAAVGLSIDDLNGKSQDEQLSIVIGKLQEMESGSERTAAASKLLGKSATDLGAVLNMTAEETDALKQEAHDYGMIMSDEAVKSSAAFEDTLTKTKGSINGLKYSIAEQFLPEVTAALDLFASAISGKKGINGVLDDVGKTIERILPKALTIVTKFGDSLTKTIKKGLPKLIKIISDAAPSILKTVSGLVIQIANALILSAPDLVRAVLQIATDLLTTIAAELPTIVDGIVAVIPELVQALTDPETMSQIFNATIQLMMAMVDAVPTIINALIPQIPVIVDNVSKIMIENAPVIAQASYEMFVGLVSAIPQVIAELIPALGDIGESIKTNFIDPISEKFSQLWEKIKTVFAPAVKWFSDLWEDVKKTTASILSSIEQKFKNAYSTIKSAFSGAGQFFAGVWTEIKNNFATVGTFFSEKFSAAYEKIKSAFSGIGEFFGGIWDTISGMFTEIGTKAGDAIGGAFKDAMNSVIETVENAINAIPDAINEMLDEINKLPGVDIPSIPSVSLPRLAKGGIIDKSTLAQIGEQGQEAVIPLERNKAGLKKIAGLLAEEMGVNVSGNGKIVGGNVYNFHQTNNSPKALSRYDIYRQTKNMIRSLELAGV